MTKFKLDLVSHVQHEVEAEDFHDAINQAKASYPNYKPDCISNEDTGETKDVVSCEGCGKTLLEDDIAMTDSEEGNNYCADCTEAIKYELATHEVKCINEDCNWSGMKADLQLFPMHKYLRCPECEEYKYLQDTKTNNYISPINSDK